MADIKQRSGDLATLLLDAVSTWVVYGVLSFIFLALFISGGLGWGVGGGCPSPSPRPRLDFLLPGGVSLPLKWPV